MPAIPVYSNSPINASKASGSTPQTEGSGSDPSTQPQVGAAATTTTASRQYTPAQPGAAPSLPVQTGDPQVASGPQPTPTQQVHHGAPPPPQPGAAPVPPMSSSRLPPPPKKGESLAQTHSTPMPPQMSYSLGGAGAPAPPTKSTVTPAYANVGIGPSPTSLQDISHPPGYQQQAGASNSGGYQQPNMMSQGSSLSPQGGQAAMTSPYEHGEEQGVWDTAKKWATAAGESLAAAEGEVWKRINKD